jgi:hypothetical protein
MSPKDTGLGVNMNELISKLFKQSGGSIEIENGNFWTYTTENYDPELFAKLIVRECIGVLNKRFMGDLNREDMEVRRCIADVEKHFGVEE